MENLNLETIIATGANDMATGSRLAMRGMIWLAYGLHVSGDKPTDYKRKVNAALLAAGRGKGEASTKSGQACVIGDRFPVLFGAQLASEYATVADFIAACFIEAEANNANAILRLVDWAKHGDADHAAKRKAQKAEQSAAEKAEALDAIERAAETAVMVNQPELGFVPAMVQVQNLNIEPETIENTIAGQLRDMTDAQLAQLAKLVAAERAERKASLANVA